MQVQVILSICGVRVCMGGSEGVTPKNIKWLHANVESVELIIQSPWSTQHEVGGPFAQTLSDQVFEWHTQHLVHLPYKQKQTL